MNRVRQQTAVTRVCAFKVRSFVVLALVVTLLLSSYVALIGLSVKNVVVRKEAEARAALLRAQVSEMESEYITRVGDISLARADGAGLTAVASKLFVERKVLVGKAY